MTSKFVLAAYVIFAVVLAWDYFAPHFHLKKIRHHIASRARREVNKNSP